MINDTINKIETRLNDATAMNPDRRKELLTLVSTLREELQDLPEEDAESISGMAHLTAHEATSEKADDSSIRMAAENLSTSVERFEVSHPRLVETVNSICTTLSGMGI